jgi:isopentenyl diphosphate isomerase/L-lactate dehydrogenase-like FMN-dependent dehydrogenase
MFHNTTQLEELEQEAKNLLEQPIYDYIAGGSGSEWGVSNNLHAFEGYEIVPRVLQNVATIDTSLEIFGKRITTPVIIGPCAFHKLVCKEGELATAKAAEKIGTIITLSTMSTYSIEEVSESSNAFKWFQLYIFKDRDITKDLIKRAEKSGYSALVVTVDVPAMGIRERDIRNKFSLPQNIQAANFRAKELSSLSTKTDGSKIKDHTDKQFDPGLTWDTIDWLKSITHLPIILKGILNSEDALEALKHNISGIIVSNHGGRQLNGVIASIDALPDIAHVIQNNIPLFVDGGIRSGEDIFKAIALGAQAVLIARPIMWSLAIGGQDKVVSTLNKLQDELTMTLRLTGCPNLEIVHERSHSLLDRKLLNNDLSRPTIIPADKPALRKLPWLR